MVTRSAPATGGGVYAAIWRWHFYAGLFVIPFVLTLALSGSLYLFKPQVDRWEERGFDKSVADFVLPHEQVETALAAYPGGSFLDYRVPDCAEAPALVRVGLPDSAGDREVFVAGDGEVRGVFDPDRRIMALVKRVHSQLLIGDLGNRLVELAACWAIVMILSGLYLWWPRGHGLQGVVWPRLTLGTRAFWRDLHAVTGFWVSALALVLLVSGLPWAGVWGPAFAAVRAEMGWVNGPSNWSVDGDRPVPAAHAHHGHDTPATPLPKGALDTAALDRMVAAADVEGLAFPAIVTPPGAPGRFGAPGVEGWTIRSDAYAPMTATIRFALDARTQVSREDFGDGHPIDRAIGYGIAWHEGQLFGWANQVIGLLTAAGLVTLTVSGFVMWRRRKPKDAFGAPKAGRLPRWAYGALIVLGLLLPLLGASFVALFVIDRTVIALRRVRAPTG